MQNPRPLILVLALALSAVLPAMARADDDRPRITVSGEGRSDVAPDMAVITVGVETRAATAADALRENSARLTAVLDRLRAAGIAPRDLQTSGLSLGPRYEHDRDGRVQSILYEASNNLTVRVRALDRLGTVLDLVVADGANSFNGLQFALSDPQPAMDAARRAAVADARRRAEMIAAEAGLRLGRVLDITEQSYGGGPRPLARMDAVMAEAPVPVEGGEVSYAAGVSIVWTLEPAN
jgi:uncharacterized protein YggE